MNLLDLYVKVGVDDQASGKMEGLSAKAIAKAQVMGQAFYDAAKFVGGKALDMGKMIVGGALQGYKAFEQLEGGAKLAFGGAYDYIEKRSKMAYRNVQLSRNEYLEQVNGFAVGLRESLGGNEQAAAELADKIITAEADIVAATGNTQENVQNAFNGIMKGNYTMLDNLQLGIKPTKEGMQEVIDKVNQWRESQGKAGNLTIDSLADCEAAVVDYVEMMGYAGYASREAMGTIEGSVAATQAAWNDLLTAIGSGNEEDIRTAVGGLIQGIFGTWDDEAGKRVGGIINNVAPVVQRVGNAILTELPHVASLIGYEFVELMLRSFGQGLDVDGIMSDLEMGMQTAFDRMQAVLDGFGAAWDSFSSTVDTGYLTLMLGNLQGIAEQLWGFIEQNVLPNMPTIGETLGIVVNFLMDLANTILTVTNNLGPFMPMLVGAITALTALNTILPVITAISGAITFFTTVIVPALSMVQSFGGAIALVTTLLGGPIPIIVALVGALAAFIMSNEDAREAISNAWQAICDWFAGLPDFFAGVWESIKTATGEAWENIKQLVLNALHEKVEQIRQKMQEAKQTVTDKWTEIVEWVRGIPGRIRNALGNLGNTLKSAGRSIISGFLSGLKAKFAEVQDWVSGIGSWIASHKGPKQYDLGLLVNNGAWIMDGLYKGLEKGFTIQTVVPYVDSMSDRLQQEVGLGMPSMTYKAAKVQQQTTMTVRDEAVIGVLTAILAAIPEQVTLDSKTLVGALAPDMNRALGAL